jgi:hypothetical protein
MIINKILLITLAASIIACGGGGSSSDSATNSGTSNSSNDDWSISTTYIADGGPGKDGIPSLQSPRFKSIDETNYMFATDLIIGVKIGNVVKGYPHKVLDWHEVVNDSIDDEKFVLSYCPLTGSAIRWDINNDTGDTQFGVSGLLFNSNLILYDRNTDSYWPQMLMKSVRGSKSGTLATQKITFEATWQSFKLMYPQAQVLDESTGFSRNYQDYPYGSFKTNMGLFFNVDNSGDARLHPKERVLGIKSGTSTKAYNISSFASDIDVIEDTVGSTEMVIAISAGDRYAVAFERTVSDGTLLNFSAIYNQLPIVMEDNEGNQWDITGKAISGTRTGEQLTQPFSFIAYWYAWAAIYSNTSVY